MRAWLADILLRVSSALYVASSWCKDRAIDVLIWPRRRTPTAERSDGGLNIVTRHEDIRG